MTALLTVLKTRSDLGIPTAEIILCLSNIVLYSTLLYCTVLYCTLAANTGG